MRLTGYVRNDGRVGFRNHIVVIPLAGCAQEIARRIAAQVTGAVVLSQPLGCDLCGPDDERLGQFLYNLATHPNVGAAVFVTLGCAAANAHKIPVKVGETGRPVKTLNLQQLGGTSATVKAGVEAAAEMAEVLNQQVRVEVPISSIVLGTKCGASDSTSFEACHPILGSTCDLFVDLGATVVLSEDYELYPAADTLIARTSDQESTQRIRHMMERLTSDLKSRADLDVKECWGDEASAYQRSLDHMAKAGTRPVRRVARLGEQISGGEGLVVLDGPNSDLISITSMTASGCNMLAFTTGRGTPVASPIAPTVKITANPKTYELMNENTDCLVTADDPQSSRKLLEDIVAHANGELTSGELAGHGEMFIPLAGVTF